MRTAGSDVNNAATDGYLLMAFHHPRTFMAEMLIHSLLRRWADEHLCRTAEQLPTLARSWAACKEGEEGNNTLHARNRQKDGERFLSRPIIGAKK